MLCKICENIFHGNPSMGLVAEGHSAHYRPHSNGAKIRLSAADGCQICCPLWNRMNVFSVSGQYQWATELSKATTTYALASESTPASESQLYILFIKTTWGGLAHTTLPLGIMPCMFTIMQKRVEATDVVQYRRGINTIGICYPNKGRIISKRKAYFTLAS
jgi:hypothetical protein